MCVQNSATMYRIDVYKNGKKVASHWYKTNEEAASAKSAILRLSGKTKTFIPGENRKKKTLTFGPWTVSKPVVDNKY